MDSEWSVIADAMDLRVGQPVLTRSYVRGISAGRIKAAVGSKVVLEECHYVRRWSETGRNSGSVYDLLAAPAAQIERGAVVPVAVIVDVGEVVPLTEEQFQRIANAPLVLGE